MDRNESISCPFDSLGATTSFVYNAAGLPTTVTDGKDNATSYSYNAQNDTLLSVSQGGSTVSYTYDGNKNLSRITTPTGTQYNFLYDEFGANTSISVGSQNLASYTYDAYGRVNTLTYGNGTVIGFVYDSLDRITEKKYHGVTKVKYTYNKSGLLHKVEDLFENTTTLYEYDFSGRPLSAKVSDGSTLRFGYDAYNRPVRISTVLPNGQSNTTTFTYGALGSANQNRIVSTGPVVYGYDSLGRLSSAAFESDGAFEIRYTYAEGQGSGSTTALVILFSISTAEASPGKTAETLLR